MLGIPKLPQGQTPIINRVFVVKTYALSDERVANCVDTCDVNTEAIIISSIF